MEIELRKANLYPSPERPSVDIERFIEGHLRVSLDQHADLEPSVLGLTEFYVDGPPRILINRDLSDAIDDDNTPLGVRGRWRATMAHEASHVVMHRVLFELSDGQEGLFRVATAVQPARLMRCLKKGVLFRGPAPADWREVQANMGMAALLMPKAAFRGAVDAALVRLGIMPEALVGSASMGALAIEMATACDVSRQAAAIRLEILGIVRHAGQQVLDQPR